MLFKNRTTHVQKTILSRCTNFRTILIFNVFLATLFDLLILVSLHFLWIFVTYQGFWWQEQHCWQGCRCQGCQPWCPGCGWWRTPSRWGRGTWWRAPPPFSCPPRAWLAPSVDQIEDTVGRWIGDTRPSSLHRLETPYLDRKELFQVLLKHWVSIKALKMINLLVL